MLKTESKSNMYSDSKYQWNPNLDYIAGFFDGEGNVVIKVSYDNRKKYKTFFGGRIQIVQTNQKLLKKIASFLGYGYVRERKLRNKKFRKSYTLEIQNETECRDFINKLKNKTFRKRDQLILLEEFYNERKNRKNYHIYSKDDALKYLEFAEKMQLLNDRNRISKHLEKVKQEIMDFDEDAYLERMKRMYKDRGKKVSEYMKKNVKINISKGTLEDLYINKKMSCPEIAKIYNCHKITIRRRLEEHNIPIRANRIKISKEKLEEYYIIQKLSCLEIAKIYECNPRTINRKLNAYNIPTRVGRSHE